MRLLSELIYEQYKAAYEKAITTQAGSERLLRAEESCLASRQELPQILRADFDKTECFCGFGTRWYADQSTDQTHHVFLLHEVPTGEIVVYYSNAPGTAYACDCDDSQGELLVTWTCEYQETGKLTRQQYRIVPLAAYFRLAFGSDKMVLGTKF